MDSKEKLTEAKLMAIENILFKVKENEYEHTCYAYAKEILQAIREVEVKQDLLDHESNLLTRDEKPE